MVQRRALTETSHIGINPGLHADILACGLGYRKLDRLENKMADITELLQTMTLEVNDLRSVTTLKYSHSPTNFVKA